MLLWNGAAEPSSVYYVREIRYKYYVCIISESEGRAEREREGKKSRRCRVSELKSLHNNKFRKQKRETQEAFGSSMHALCQNASQSMSSINVNGNVDVWSA